MIGVKIRDLRKRLGLTQEQLAGHELTKSYVSQVELGRIRPSQKALQIMANRLNKPLGYFLENDDDLRTVDVLLKAAHALWTSGRLDEALVGLEEAHHLAGRMGRDDVIAKIRTAMGRLELFRGNPVLAVEHLESARTLISSQDYPSLLIEMTAVLGIATSQLEQFHKAVHYFQLTSEHARQLPDKDAPLRAYALESYGDFCFNHHEWRSALDLYQEALGTNGAQSLLPSPTHTELLIRIASTQWALDLKDEAERSMKSAVQWLSSCKESHSTYRLMVDLAHLLTFIGHYHEAEHYVDLCLQHFRHTNLVEGEASALDAGLELAQQSTLTPLIQKYTEDALDHSDQWPWLYVKSRAYVLRAADLFDSDPSKALALLLQARRLSPDNQDLTLKYWIIAAKTQHANALDELWQWAHRTSIAPSPRRWTTSLVIPGGHF